MLSDDGNASTGRTAILESLDPAELSDDDQGVGLGAAMLQSSDEVSVDNTLTRHLQALLASLDPRDRQAVSLRLGLGPQPDTSKMSNGKKAGVSSIQASAIFGCSLGGEGLNSYRIAELMGMSRQAVDQRLSRALKKLREAVKQDAELALALGVTHEASSNDQPPTRAVVRPPGAKRKQPVRIYQPL